MLIRKLYCSLIFTIMGLCACTKTETLVRSPIPEPDFAFTLEYGSCNRDVLYTFEGTFTKDMIVDPDVTISFQLTAEQLTEIYQKLVEIGFWDLPEVYAIPTPKDGTVGIVTPAMEYRLTVRNGGETKTLYWVDEIFDPTSPEAEGLRDLFNLVIGLVQNSPEYQQLPTPAVGCL